MTVEANACTTSPGPAGTKPRFIAWRDAYGREHPEVPRCLGGTKPRSGRSRWTSHECKRKGVVQRGTYGGREAWFCLQHDPRREDDRRVETLAPTLLDLVREALDLVVLTRRTEAWRKRAEAVVGRADLSTWAKAKRNE
jgi:hypothetical protein